MIWRDNQNTKLYWHFFDDENPDPHTRRHLPIQCFFFFSLSRFLGKIIIILIIINIAHLLLSLILLLLFKNRLISIIKFSLLLLLLVNLLQSNIDMDNSQINTDDDDDRAQEDGTSSDDDDNSHTSRHIFLSNEDIDKCLYVTNINWRRKFSVSEQQANSRVFSFIGNNNHWRYRRPWRRAKQKSTSVLSTIVHLIPRHTTNRYFSEREKEEEEEELPS